MSDFLRRTVTVASALVGAPDNKTTYLSSDAVHEYTQYSELYPPERVIKDRLGSWLTGKRMLDVGVGGGRTTLHFARIVGSYVGVDYSSAMIEACKARLGDKLANASFEVADVRKLGAFDSGAFDFVLFSINGLDSISHSDRLVALAELYRVCSPAGLVCFSAHNICAVDRLFDVLERNPATVGALVQDVVWQGVFRLVNPSQRRLLRMPYALVRDGALQFRLKNYYIRPSEQIAQLRSAGFENVEVYGFDGRQIAPDAADQARSMFLYYLAAPDASILQCVLSHL